MEQFKGIGVSRGVAVGEAFVIESERMPVRPRQIPKDQAEAEVQRYERAVATAIEGIRDDQRRLAPKLGGEYLAIFETHIRMLDDRRLCDDIIDRIRTGHVAAEAAADEVLRKYITLLLEDQSTARWVPDIYDVQNRLHRVLLGRQSRDVRQLEKPVAIIAEDLMPSQMVGFDRDKVLAITMEKGGVTSHTAIIANALGIPAVVGLGGLTAGVQIGRASCRERV